MYNIPDDLEKFMIIQYRYSMQLEDLPIFKGKLISKVQTGFEKNFSNTLHGLFNELCDLFK